MQPTLARHDRVTALAALGTGSWAAQVDLCCRLLDHNVRSVRAHIKMWFSGTIQIPVGDFDEDTEEFESVIAFEIENGIVSSKSFFTACRLSNAWNGK